MTAIGEGRETSFFTYLQNNNIPVTGYVNNDNTVEHLTIQYAPSATAEQIAWSENAKGTFDWRKQRVRTEADLYANFSGLTIQERAALQARAFSIVARTNPDAMERALIASGITLPLTEVDPNP